MQHLGRVAGPVGVRVGVELLEPQHVVDGVPGHLAEDGVLVVEPGALPEAEEELRAKKRKRKRKRKKKKKKKRKKKRKRKRKKRKRKKRKRRKGKESV